MAKATKAKVEHPCLFDGEEIPNWRSNKKFCNDECKFKYYNKKNRTVVDEDIKHIHGILAANYSILQELIGEENSVDVEYKTLKDQKFDFDFQTQVIGGYHNVYKLSWLKLGSGKYRISRVSRKTYRGGFIIK